VSETQPSPVALRVAVALVGLLLVGVVVLSQVLGGDDDASPSDDPTAHPTATRTGPIALVPVEAPQADSAECASLTEALPEQLPNADHPMRSLPIAKPAPKATAAWGSDSGGEVVLRCGLPRPAELTPTTMLRKIDDVQWAIVEGGSARSWYVVDRPVYVAVTVTGSSNPGALQELSAVVADSLDEVPVRVG
jgi:Protein of unknown function (DUF3515)